MKTFVRIFLPLLWLTISLPGLSSGRVPHKSDYRVCAFIWPSCHDDSLARALIWPEGRGEWEIIDRGTPRFPGHYQPRQPLWHGDMDDDPAVVEKWIRTALAYGVDTFVYDWYWFRDYPFLEGALDDGFLKAPSCRKMDFYIMYANHEVTNYWNPYNNSDDKTLLFDPRIGWDEWKVIVERVIRQYFHRPNYVKIAGCPVFALWRIDLFAEGFGSLEEAGKAMDYFRAEVRKAGFPDLHLQLCGAIGKLGERDVAMRRAELQALKVQSFAAYNMGGFNVDYLVHGMNAIMLRDWWAQTFGLPLFPTVSVGWDNTPRYPANGANTITCFNHTPEAFASFVQTAKEYADAHADRQPRFIMLNAWNEYVEGSYLLPDRRDGFRFLQAVRDVLEGKYDRPQP